MSYISKWVERTALTTIKVRHQFVGFHSWDDAPEGSGYLRDKHRHVFKLVLRMSYSTQRVLLNKREIEFHWLQQRLEAATDHLQQRPGGLRNVSCEAMAMSVLDWIVEHDEPQYAIIRKVSVEVSEDGENSAKVTNWL